MSTSQLVFPAELRDQDHRPCILFEAHDRLKNDNQRIVLPSPPSISFSDSADFSTIDLGSIGGAAIAALQGDTSNVKSVKAMQVMQTIAQQTPAKELSNFLGRSVANPNTNSTFTGNKTRSFGFNFKLVARSKDESTTIKDIHTAFRHYTYAVSKPDTSNITLDFPPVWTIKFVDFGSPTGENKYIPRIYSCYLTQVESTFNSDANMFFNDSAPLQVDISLQFQETRVLTRNDIADMENDKLGNRGIDENGNPTVSSNVPQKEQTPS